MCAGLKWMKSKAVACIRVLGGVIASTDAQQPDHLGAGGKDNNQFQWTVYYALFNSIDVNLSTVLSKFFYAGAASIKQAQHFCSIRLLCIQSWCEWFELEQQLSLQGLSSHWEVVGLDLATSYQELHSHPPRTVLLPFESSHPRLLPSHYTASNMLLGLEGQKLQMNQLNWQFRRIHRNWQWTEILWNLPLYKPDWIPWKTISLSWTKHFEQPVPSTLTLDSMKWSRTAQTAEGSAKYYQGSWYWNAELAAVWALRKLDENRI